MLDTFELSLSGPAASTVHFPSTPFHMSAPSHEAWTLVVWRVVQGREQDFVQAWTTLRDIVVSLDQPPIWYLLLQNQYDSGTYYSVGPWNGFEAVKRMRRDPRVQDAFQKLVECCHEATPDTCRRVEGSDS
jgi:hypothetical protein